MEIPNHFHFVATFADGTQIFQNEEDRSEITPGKNCYYDVMGRADLVSFVITDGEQVFGVDLRDGHFEVNGVPFFQHRPDLPTQAFKDFDLIYSRTLKHEIEANTNEPIRDWISAYTIGWKSGDVEKTFTVYFE
jgi:hypothetical protein